MFFGDEKNYEEVFTMNIQGLPKKIIENFLIFLAIILVGYLSFALVGRLA